MAPPAQADAPAVCAGCKVAHYCGPECQRVAWKASHKSACAELGRVALVAAANRRADRTEAKPQRRAKQEPTGKTESTGEEVRWPVRCPSSILRGELPRLDRIDSTRAQDLLGEGEAFVAPMEGLLGTKLLKWDFKYLRDHLPSGQKYGVMLDEGSGSGKIVMSHSARNGARQIDMSTGDPSADGLPCNSDDGLFNTSDQTRMTFDEFVKACEKYKAAGFKGRLPYFGLHLLWRFKEEDNGFLGQIDEHMASDLWSIKFNLIKEWQEQNVLPLVQRFYLFAGLGGTLYHCHYDLQPNLHVQLSGRKRFILFPPEDWPHLYPFPVHHDLDRRSMVDLDSPVEGKFPKWKGAHGRLVELNPGDALYIPPFWWHHVQSLTPETTSMAMWFFEHYPQSSNEKFGVGLRAEDVLLSRDVEELVGKFFADAPGEEDCTKARPVKARQVANFMQWLKPRVGLEQGEVDRPLLNQLKKKPEQVEAMMFQMLREHDGARFSTDSRIRGQLKAFLDRRY